MKYCSYCNLSFSDEYRFCKTCGRILTDAPEPAPTTAYCLQCGSPLRPGKKFCNICGTPVVNARPRETTVFNEHPVEEPFTNSEFNQQQPIAPTQIVAATQPITSSEATAAEPALVRCPECGEVAYPKAIFCEECGAALDGSGIRADESDEELYLSSAETVQIPTISREGESAAGEGESPQPQLAPLQGAPEFSSDAETEEVPIQSISQSESIFHAPTQVIPAPEPPVLPVPAEKPDRLLPILVVSALVLVAIGAVGLWWYWYSTRSTSQPQVETTSTTAQEPQPPPLPTAATPTPPPGMVYVQGGKFMMGRNDGEGFEVPAHEVEVKPFFIDRTEVTNAEYKRFIDSTGYPAPKHWRNGAYAEGKGDFPVTNITWADADQFARWAGKRLPTEAEWEIAARGADGRIYPWGNVWRPDAASSEVSGNKLTAVGSYTAGASPSGALDMAGSVWEWTASNLEPYPGSSARLPSGGPFKVIRGGAYLESPKYLTSTYRHYQHPEVPDPAIGFRCAKSAD